MLQGMREAGSGCRVHMEERISWRVLPRSREIATSHIEEARTRGRCLTDAPPTFEVGWAWMALGEATSLPALPAPIHVPAAEAHGDELRDARVLPVRRVDIEALICAQPWPCAEALAVVYGPTPTCPTGESNGRADAYNAGSYGLMQIMYSAHVDKLRAVTGSDDPALLYDPAVNVAVGWLVYLANGGWSAWSCRP